MDWTRLFVNAFIAGIIGGAGAIIAAASDNDITLIEVVIACATFLLAGGKDAQSLLSESADPVKRPERVR